MRKATLAAAVLLGCAGGTETSKVALKGGETATFDAELLGQAAWKRSRWGLRLGLFAPGPFADEGFVSAVGFGGFYQGLQYRKKKVIYELGVDYSASSSGSGYVDSTLLFLRAEAMLAAWERIGSRNSLYFLAGAGMLLEFARDSVEETSYVLYEPTVDVGLGWGRARAGWDLRATYAYMPGSKNALGLLIATVSYAF